MAYKYKEYNFKDCAITRVGDSFYIDIGKNKDIIPYVADFLSDKIKDATEIVIDYISDRYNRKNQTVIYKIEKGKNKGTWGYRYYGKYTTISKRFCDILNKKEVTKWNT